MKTSELILKLQAIDKTVPFDADVVTGDDFEFDRLQKVFHDAPRTFLEFKNSEKERLSEIIELLPSLFEAVESGELTTKQALTELNLK